MSIVEQLAKSEVSVFRGVGSEHLQALVEKMTRRSLKDGEVICEVGAEGDSMYLVLSGRIRVYLPDEEGNELTFRYYEKYQTVGEIALLDGKPRSASLAAAADVDDPDAPIEVFVLHRQDFLDFLRERPAVGLSMMRDLTSRVRYTTTYLEKVTEAINLMLEEDYEQALQEVDYSSDDEQIQNMIAEFLQMIRSVQARQQSLDQNRGAVAPDQLHE